MSDRQSLPASAQWIVAALFAVLGLATLYWFITFAEPPERTHQAPFQQNYSEAPLLAALHGKDYAARVHEIASFGSRLSGSPGFYRTEQYIVEEFRKAGLEVQTQEFPVVVPVTEVCEISDSSGRPLPDVQLFPFTPSGLIPVSCVVSGNLVVTEGTELKFLTGHDPRQSIGVTLLDAAEGWRNFAAVGVPALLVREDGLAKSLQPDPDAASPWEALVTNDETTYPRFLVRGPIEKYAGTAVTIRCRVTWQTKAVRNVLGVLHGEQPKAEALVVTSFYDSNSLVPDQAPGGEQSISLAVMLDYAHALARYRGQLQRDVVFIATAGHAQALSGACQLMQALETFSQQRSDYRPLEARLADEKRWLEYTARTAPALDELKSWSPQDGDFHEWFKKEFLTVAGEINLQHKEAALAARLAYLRAGSPVFRDGFDPQQASDAARKDEANSHPLLRAYLQAQTLDNRSANLLALPIAELARRPEFAEWDYARLAREHFQRLAEYHRQRIQELTDLLGVRDRFAPYARTLTVNLELYSGGSRQLKDLAILIGTPGAGTVVEPQITDLANMVLEKIPRAERNAAFKTISWGARDAAGSPEQPNRISPSFTELESEVWFRCGRLAFTISNYGFFPPKVGTPEDKADDLRMEAVAQQVPVLGRTLLELAFGRMTFKTIPSDRQRSVFAVAGNVGVAAVVASHPMGRHTFVRVVQPGNRTLTDNQSRGVRLYPILPVNPYGRYARPVCFDFHVYGRLSGDAARFDEAGHLLYIKDAGAASQSLFRNENVPGADLVATTGQAPKPMNIALFRCAPVALYNRINPRTMRPFVRVDYLSQAGLTPPPRLFLGGLTAFLEPDQTIYLGLLDGSAENPEIQTYRAFMLNANPAVPVTAEEADIFGAGYLANDTPNLALPHLDAAGSMVRTAAKRLDLQQRYGMADEQMLAFQARAKEWLGVAREKLAQFDLVAAVNAAGTSLAYGINNHPVIRSRISQAVIGILWYLGLLVPFVLFAEKLIFGYADIRKQLLAIAIIFLVMFTLLRIFHPAFQMVRSSMMILLGFVIMLLTLLVTLMVGGKFRQNIKELRQKEGRVEGADINRGGVVGASFLLGLNNMRRRKVRTGLTCLTLILITFVMICFTSVSSDLVNVEYPTARTAWNGILLRNPNFKTIAAAQVQNIRQIYGEQYPIATTDWLVPELNNSAQLQNVEVIVDREFTVNGTPTAKRAKVNSAVRLDWSEPQFSQLDQFLLTNRGWFPRPPQSRAERLAASRVGRQVRNSVILPDTMAQDLGITRDDVNTTNIFVDIRGEAYEVLGIIDSVGLTKCLGLDGQSILPYDINSIQTLGTQGVPETINRLNGSQVILVNKMPQLKSGEQAVTVECRILFPKVAYQVAPDAPRHGAVDYKEQRRVVLDYLERTGQPAYYAVDGVGYYGSRRRETTVAGLLQLLVPILIAALTVFNTMRGSVYERKDEIYVYNAVGIAPNHVFFMFMAEACVYSVVGAMLGYVLSQATGRVLSAIHLTGGMNMDYSSIETVYASWAICAAVLLSTLIPARDAARLASPSGVVSWDVPEAKHDTMEFNLPFTFTAHDRVAVISYFRRWLEANGAGSSGPFYCAPPEVQLKAAAELIPALATTVWLKPYDLGVSQRLVIALPTDPETGEFIARITLVRQSGHTASWQRTVKPFLSALRKQFLNWRATTEADRGEMFAEAKQLLQEVAHG
ncbi:MAG: hypothetical protein PCFJNLEI_00638 [Verrucomicrobiae bacterium]|nr:hypothetical protein [Verrucomicrobiae bacterium]